VIELIAMLSMMAAGVSASEYPPAYHLSFTLGKRPWGGLHPDTQTLQRLLQDKQLRLMPAVTKRTGRPYGMALAGDEEGSIGNLVAFFGTGNNPYDHRVQAMMAALIEMLDGPSIPTQVSLKAEHLVIGSDARLVLLQNSFERMLNEKGASGSWLMSASQLRGGVGPSLTEHVMSDLARYLKWRDKVTWEQSGE